MFFGTLLHVFKHGQSRFEFIRKTANEPKTALEAVLGFLFCPAVTAEKFAELTGLPVGVIDAQLDRRILPVVKLGKRRLVNLEALRLIAQSQAAHTPIKTSDGASNTVTNGSPVSFNQ
jgi:hypothetical protein